MGAPGTPPVRSIVMRRVSSSARAAPENCDQVRRLLRRNLRRHSAAVKSDSPSNFWNTARGERELHGSVLVAQVPRHTKEHRDRRGGCERSTCPPGRHARFASGFRPEQRRPRDRRRQGRHDGRTQQCPTLRSPSTSLRRRRRHRCREWAGLQAPAPRWIRRARLAQQSLQRESVSGRRDHFLVCIRARRNRTAQLARQRFACSRQRPHDGAMTTLGALR